MKLSLYNLMKMSLDEQIQAYQMGYSLEDLLDGSIYPNIDDVIPISPRRGMFGVASLGTCVGSITKGATKPITISGSGGTSPYKYDLIVDGSIKQTWTSQTGPVVYNYTFNETAGTHEYRVRITDSCSVGGKVNEDFCSITITECQLPTVTISI